MSLLRGITLLGGTPTPRPEAAAGMARVQSLRMQHEDRAGLAPERAFPRALGG